LIFAPNIRFPSGMVQKWGAKGPTKIIHLLPFGVVREENPPFMGDAFCPVFSCCPKSTIAAKFWAPDLKG
jgi:hypothetical protein